MVALVPAPDEPVVPVPAQDMKREAPIVPAVGPLLVMASPERPNELAGIQPEPSLTLAVIPDRLVNNFALAQANARPLALARQGALDLVLGTPRLSVRANEWGSSVVDLQQAGWAQSQAAWVDPEPPAQSLWRRGRHVLLKPLLNPVDRKSYEK